MMDSKFSKKVHFDPHIPIDSHLHSLRQHTKPCLIQNPINLASEVLKEQPILSGYLKKKINNKIKMWKSFWCVLRPNALTLYKSEEVLPFSINYNSFHIFFLSRFPYLTFFFITLYTLLQEYKTKVLIKPIDMLQIAPIKAKKNQLVFGIVTQKKACFFLADNADSLNLWVNNLRSARNLSLKNSNSLSTPTNNPTTSSTHNPNSVQPQDTPHSIFPEPPPKIPNFSHKYHSDSQQICLSSDINPSHFNSKDYSSSMHDLCDYFVVNNNVESDSINSSCSNNSSDNYSLDCQITNPRLDQNDSAGHRKNTMLSAANNNEIIAESSLQQPQGDMSQIEKIQQQFANDQVIKSGYLYKQGRLKGWYKRWFVLRSNSLSYYHNNKEYKLNQIFPKSCIFDARLPDPSSNKASSTKRSYFRLVTLKRSYWLAHEDANTISDWISAIKLLIDT
ncbi:Differentially expressed in FDCP 6-like protein [Smittium culicis]|uniref:Differentially expressed in FDCP 6-like protein n=1 Tax=Smittium culicis TaxID=133412 RepID=A0A1R1YPH1_9FUNG|nr:Differentially expressed in FDCP 6-like protein [Smittium culicis]